MGYPNTCHTTCHVTCQAWHAWQSSWNQVSNHEVMIPSHHHTSPPLRAALRGHQLLLLFQPSLNSSHELSAAPTQLSAALMSCQKGTTLPSGGFQTAPDGAVCMRGMTTPLSFPFLSLLSPWKAGLTPSLLPSCFMEGEGLVEACVLASTREQWSVAGVARVFG